MTERCGARRFRLFACWEERRDSAWSYLGYLPITMSNIRYFAGKQCETIYKLYMIFNWSPNDFDSLVRYGAKPLELTTGKATVEVVTNDNLIETLEIIKKGVEAGEFDSQIESTSAVLRTGFKRWIWASHYWALDHAICWWSDVLHDSLLNTCNGDQHVYSQSHH